MNKFFPTITVGLFLLVIGGCVTPVYDKLPPLPTYPESDARFDTSAFIDVTPDANKGFTSVIYSLLEKYGYSNALVPIRAASHDLDRTWILTLLHVLRTNYNCADGAYLETRVIVMVRQPGEVWDGKLKYKKPRYFQAFARHKILNYGAPTTVELASGYFAAMANLFRIQEFRQALEPVKQESLEGFKAMSPESMWQRSLALQKNGYLSDALYYSFLAADKGHLQAEKYLLANTMYASIFSGKELFRIVCKKAEAGDSAAQNKLGLMYLYGKAVSENNDKAFYWFSKAAEQNLAVGQLNVGYCYEHGYGVEKNIPMAISWYRKAANNGSKSGAVRLKRLTGE